MCFADKQSAGSSRCVARTLTANLAQELINLIVKDSASAGAKAQAVSDVRSALGLGGEWTIGKVVYTAPFTPIAESMRCSYPLEVGTCQPVLSQYCKN